MHVALSDQKDAHDDGLVGQRQVELEHHLFPNDGCFALGNECAMGGLCKRFEGLEEGGVGRVELLLCEGVVYVAGGVELITAGTKVGRGEG